MGDANERENDGLDEIDEELHSVQDQENKWAKKQLPKSTEFNVRIGEKRVHPVKIHVGSKASYFRPHRYVDR